MTSARRDERIMEIMMQVVKARKEVSRIDLIGATGITLNEYGRVKPFFEEKFQDLLEYERSTKKWKWIAPEEKENGRT